VIFLHATGFCERKHFGFRILKFNILGHFFTNLVQKYTNSLNYANTLARN
jgi:hypothetical protein